MIATEPVAVVPVDDILMSEDTSAIIILSNN